MPVRGNLNNLDVGQLLSASAAGDLKGAIGYAAANKFDFVAVPLAADEGQGAGADFEPSADSALSLPAAAWSSSVVGLVSDGLDPDGCPAEGDAARGGAAPEQAEARRACLETELRWAAHIGVRGTLLPPPASAAAGGGALPFSSYARAVNELLLEGLFAEVATSGQNGSPPPLALRVGAGGSGWHAWDNFRNLCDHHPRLGVALELDVPKLLGDGCTEKDLERWIGEPVRFVILHHTAFLRNKQGFPVLPKKLKALLTRLFKHNVEVILAPCDQVFDVGSALCPETKQALLEAQEPGQPDTVDGAVPDVIEAVAFTANALLKYVALLYQSSPPPTQAERFCATHLDTLQCPLQPLADHLESETYEVFEEDPVKYRQYQEAVFQFLRDRVAAGRKGSFTIMVLGAGRGPLVEASLKAAARAGATVEVFAVEKNPNAVHALRHRKRRDAGWEAVEVVATDMRDWKAPRKADAIVSELLGSFSDNELSPECLDGAQHLLADDGVSIPCSYVSSVAPVSAAALWADARSQEGSGNGAGGMHGGDSGQLETGYVVSIHRAFYPSAEPKDCFEFRHPKRRREDSNDRAVDLSFEALADCTIHGFAGYFDCTLYGDVRISIRPDTFSEGMFSWFPLFIPLQVPITLRRGQEVRSHWWRRHDARKVWYEWALSEPRATPVQNPGGRSWSMGLHV